MQEPQEEQQIIKHQYYSFFINCTDTSTSSCETSPDIPGFLGSVGICDKITNLCICPSGYDGNDFAASFNDCHVNSIFRLSVDSICLVTLLVAGLITLSSILRLLYVWGIIHWNRGQQQQTSSGGDGQDRRNMSSSKRIPFESPTITTTIIISPETIPLELSTKHSSPRVDQDDGSPTTTSFLPRRRSTFSKMMIPAINLGELQSPRTNARSNSFQQMITERKRRRNILALLLSWGIYCLAGVILQIHRLFGYRIEQSMPFMLICLSLITSLSICGLWLLTYTWFSNLPSLHLFANMFPSIKDSILIKNPEAFKLFAITNCIFACFCYLTVFLILPLAIPSSVLIFLQIGFVLLAAQIATFTTTHLMVCIILLKLFKSYNNSPIATIGSQQSFGEGEKTVKFMIASTAFASPFVIIWLLVMAFSPGIFRYYFFFFSVILCLGALVAIVVSYIFVFRMGSKIKAKRTTTTSSRHVSGGGAGGNVRQTSLVTTTAANNNNNKRQDKEQNNTTKEKNLMV